MFDRVQSCMLTDRENTKGDSGAPCQTPQLVEHSSAVMDDSRLEKFNLINMESIILKRIKDR